MAVVEVVKYNGAPDVFAWKYPSEDLGTWTQLIVNETQEAILFKGGKALDVFGSGRHTLETANIPLLNQIINLPFGGRSPFAAEVWYVNKIHSLDIKWGTPTPIQLQDAKYKILVPVRSFGQFGIKVEDSKKFLLKLVGTLSDFTKEDIIKYFRGLYVTKVKDALSSYLINKQISVLEISAYLDQLSEFMKERIAPTLDEYGITLVNFYVNDISVPEDDPGVIQLKEALAKKAEMDILGYNYQQERSFDTLEEAAGNPGSASAAFMGAGIGLGMGVGMGGAMGQQFGTIAGVMNTEAPKGEGPAADAPKIKCSKCGSELNPQIKFCSECGSPYNPCPQCKADMEEGATACTVCGYTFPAPCPNCGKPIENKNIKFCPECGTALIQKCPKCETALENNPKFCPECGENLR